jgi:hypothetical protein
MRAGAPLGLLAAAAWLATGWGTTAAAAPGTIAAGARAVPAPVPAHPPVPVPAATAPTRPVFKWSSGPLNDAAGPIAESSPTVATLDSAGPAAVVGDRDGRVYAYHLTGGSAVTGWPVAVGVPVTSTPSVTTLGGSDLDSVFFGSGNATEFYEGGYQGFGPAGNQLWSARVTDPGSDTQPAQGVQASLSVGFLEGADPDVVAGSLDQEEYALDAATGSTLDGWPFFTSDSVFSTAALADLYGTGQTDIVEGGDQTAGFGLGQEYPQGGHLRILNAEGGLICHYDTDQTVESSPAIGDFLAGGHIGIVMGTGQYFSDASDTDRVMAFDNDCGLEWSTTLDGYTNSSPAVADVTGNGTMDVVEGTQTASGGGSVWVLDGADGSPIWHAAATGEVIGLVVTADLTGTGHQDILVPTTQGLDIFSSSGTLLWVLNGKGTTAHGVLGFQNSPLVTDDPNGTAGITVAGYGCTGGPATCKGYVEHYEMPGATGAEAVGAGSWPEFHHDPQLTGNTGGTPGPGSTSRCTVPAAALSGYALVAADGGIFAYGSTPFCGSTGGMSLNAPIVGMAMAPNTGGYWLVASDGGIFAYGGARFYGSMGGRPLNRPIIGMAATPDGRGYWLVASDGGIFAFGDAQFYGSTGSLTLEAPIVGMAPTVDGLGYRLVAADGGIFAYGDAQFFGSMGGQKLVAPIVGMAVDPATAGYWLVAADGGIFAFGAPFYGSEGGQALAAPIVGMTAAENGTGYRFVASDGGIFSFPSGSGGLPFYGSMGGRPLDASVVGMAGF